MALLWLCNVSISFQGVPVLEDVNAYVSPGARVGIIGPNGCGKSTLLRIITGDIKPGRGVVEWAKTPNIGYVTPQEDAGVFQQKTPLDLISPERAGALGRFGLPSRLWDKPAAALSGGERTRLRLALAFSKNPDVLVLDEPTNHLDIHGIQQLEAMLKEFPGTVLVVSHDRYFLDSVCSEIWLIENCNLRTYKGNYSAYLQARQAEQTHMAREYAKWQTAVDRLAVEVRARQQWYDRAHKAAGTNDYLRRRAKKHATQFKAKQRRLDKLLDQKPEKPRKLKPVTIKFQEGSHRTKTILRARDLCFRYAPGAPQVIKDACFSVSPGEKIALVGPNGSGKTTMIRLFAGELQPEAGSLWVNPNIRVGYLAQMLEHLDLSRSAADNVSTHTGRPIPEARHLLGYLGVSKHTQMLPLGKLSMGQRTKVALACLTFAPYDLLLMDEPTNHLDLIAREAVEAAVRAFPGAAIIASHDRYLVDKSCTSIWYLEQGKLHVYGGSFAEFTRWLESRKSGRPDGAAGGVDTDEAGGGHARREPPGDRKAMELALKTRLAYIASQLALADDARDKLRLETEYQEALAQLRRLEASR